MFKTFGENIEVSVKGASFNIPNGISKSDFVKIVKGKYKGDVSELYDKLKENELFKIRKTIKESKPKQSNRKNLGESKSNGDSRAS